MTTYLPATIRADFIDFISASTLSSPIDRHGCATSRHHLPGNPGSFAEGVDTPPGGNRFAHTCRRPPAPQDIADGAWIYIY